MLAAPATLRAQNTDQNNESIWPKSEREQLFTLCLNIICVAIIDDSKKTARGAMRLCSLPHIPPQSPTSLY